MLVHPRVDLRRLRRAYEKLSARHDVLRLRFEPHKDTWQAVIEPPGRARIKEVDLGDQDDEVFLAEIARIAKAPMSMVGCLQSEMVLVHCGSRGDVLIWRVNHSISDGYGMSVLTEDLLKFLVGIPVLGQVVSHAVFVARYEDAPPHRAAEIRAYWEKLHENPPPAPDIGRKAKGLPANVMNHGFEPRRLSISPTESSLARLREHATANATNFASTMFSGFLEALCQNYDVDDLLFSTNVARTNPALATFAGEATNIPILRYRPAGSGRMDHAARTLGAQLMDAIEHLPSKLLVRDSPYEHALIAEGAFPRQFSCNHPRHAALQSRSVFSSILNTTPGAVARFAGYSISAVDISEFSYSFYDLGFRVVGNQNAEVLHLAYDGIGYTEGEIRALADRICTLLNLEPSAITTG